MRHYRRYLVIGAPLHTHTQAATAAKRYRYFFGSSRANRWGVSEQRNMWLYRITVTQTATPDGVSLTAPLTAVIAVKTVDAAALLSSLEHISVGRYAHWHDGGFRSGVLHASARKGCAASKTSPSVPLCFRYSRMNDNLTNRDNAPRVPICVYRFGTRAARARLVLR